ncbi:MAG: hypothetical protein P8I38_02490 [Arenicella sp.]|nr:hypothetical protein [Arenicella sp.]
MNLDNVAWSCVVDDVPNIWCSLIPWLASLTGIARVQARNIHIHHVCDLKPAIAELCEELGVNTHRIEPFNPRSPHSNKINQCFTQFESVKTVFTDVDVVFSSCPPIHQLTKTAAAKPVDMPNPDFETLEKIYSAAKLNLPNEIIRHGRIPGGEILEFTTLCNNFNGGFYVFNSSLLSEIGPSWAKWAHWLIERVSLMGRRPIHIDQVALSLALSELKIEVELLPDIWNFPFHLQPIPDGPEPIVLHHHSLLDESFHLDPAVSERTRNIASKVNRATDDFCAKHGFAKNSDRNKWYA